MHNKTKQIVRSLNLFTIILAMVAATLLLLTSCSQPGSSTKGMQLQTLSRLKQNAQRTVDSQPDSSLLYADSALRHLAKKGNFDTSFVAVALVKADAWLNKGVPDSAISILLRARTIAIGSYDTLAMANCAYKLGEILVEKEAFISAEKYIKEAETYYEKQKNDYKAAATYHLKSSFLIARGNNIDAQNYLMKASDIFKRLDSINALGVIYITIARNYNISGNKLEAAKYFRLGISKLTLAKDTSSLRMAYISQGVMYRNSFSDSAMICYNKAIALLAASDSDQPPIIEKYNIANLYLDNKQYSKAIEEYDKVLELCQRYKLTGGIARVYSGYASIFDETGKHALAATYLIKAVHIADSTGDVAVAIKLRQELMENYREQGYYKAAMLMDDTIKAIRDTLTTKTNQLALKNLEKLHQAENKEFENTLLKKELKSQAERSSYRWLIIVILAVALIVTLYLNRKISKLYIERRKAYDSLINKYKQESELLSRLRSIKPTDSHADAEPNTLDENKLLLEQMIEYFITQKPYLNPKLKVADVAEKLDCSRKEISLALKGCADSHFNAFTNRFRVDAAIAMMEDPTYKNFKIEAIAKDSGFGSKSNFYDKFESCTGVRFNYYWSSLNTKKDSDTNNV